MAGNGLQLERVIGLTSLHNAALAAHPRTGELAYVAGATVVLYSPRRNRQVDAALPEGMLPPGEDLIESDLRRLFDLEGSDGIDACSPSSNENPVKRSS